MFDNVKGDTYMRNKRRKALKRYIQKRLFVYSVLLIVATVFIAKFTMVTASAKTTDRYKYYTSEYVDRGESLWDIADKYMTMEYASPEAYIREVKKINHLLDDELAYGITITVPYYSEILK